MEKDKNKSAVNGIDEELVKDVRNVGKVFAECANPPQKERGRTVLKRTALIAAAVAVGAFGLFMLNGSVRAEVLPVQESDTLEETSSVVRADDPFPVNSWEYAQQNDYYHEEKNLFGQSYDIADEDQRAGLIELYDKYRGLTWEHEREIKIIMGELPEDTPRLTRDTAYEICKGIDPNPEHYGSIVEFEAEIVRQFNLVAGAPDLNGGSGTTYRVYYLDETGDLSIRVQFCSVTYCDSTNDTIEILLYSDELETIFESKPEKYEKRGDTWLVLRGICDGD